MKREQVDARHRNRAQKKQVAEEELGASITFCYFCMKQDPLTFIVIFRFGRLPPQRVQSDVGGVLLDLPSTLQDPRPSIQGYESQALSNKIDTQNIILILLYILNGLITSGTISYNTTVSETEAPSSHASIISSDFQHQRCQFCPNEYITRSVRTTLKLSRSLSKGIKKRREGTGAGVS
ncbi:hypothetical protein ALC57_18645 [Trachymyrmex cornetzi]|uniref:Uncharacterized protein n=1 Tax=Trachymyrmex cornetzi TaxID=471704 RepID=A0A195D8J6_9HYME|nr:hypothetical protein ALC57_18645 [Trachymyrmex cornetzi]